MAAIDDIRADSLTGSPPVAEYLKVFWDSGTIKYYGAAAWHDIAPHTGIGVTVEARLKVQNKKDPFHELELDPDIRTETLTVTFDDIDKDITSKFQTYGSGVRCEFYLYYPSEAYTVMIWSGQLQAPDDWGWSDIKAKVTNGFKSRELFIPSRNHRGECTANVFAGLLPDTDAVRSSLCPYDYHLGGAVGVAKTGSTPYADCPKLSKADCNLRFGTTDGKYYGGYVTNAANVIGSPRTGYLAVSRGNASNLTESVRVVAGTKIIRANTLLLYSVQDPHPERGWLRTLWELGEGPVSSMYNFKINDKMIGQEHLNFRLGTRGQPRTNYATDVHNFSSTAHVFAVYGYVANPLNVKPGDLTAECTVKGFSEVCVYTDDSPVTKTRIWSDDRVWWLLEVYRNQKFGLGYKEDQFTILDWMTAATWGTQVVSHTATFPDGESIPYISRRTAFNAILEGRRIGEQVEDICRSGGLFLPFLHDGEFTISAARAATAGELSAARTFTDNGQSVNIIWEGEPLITLSKTPDDKVVNKVEVRFEEASNFDTERPFTVDDPNQQLKAGRQLGQDYFLAVPKSFSGFGINSLPEAIRLAYRLLWFGEFDEGGTQNNLRVKITMPFEQYLGLRRYEVIEVVSDILDGHTIGTGVLAETPQYFRILKAKKVSGGRCQVTAQAYNHTAYTAFEVDSVLTSGHPVLYVTQAGTAFVNAAYHYTGTFGTKVSYESGAVQIRWNTGSSRWQFLFGTSVLYYSTDAVASPELVTTWVATDGALPLPVIDTVRPPIDPPCEVPLSTPTYDPLTGILSVVIDPC